MSVEALLTVVTVVLAVFALIPAERSLDFRIRMGILPRFIAGVSCSLTLYWALLEEIHSLPLIRWLPRPLPWVEPWKPATASLCVILAATAFGWWCYGLQLPVGRVPMLAIAVRDLLSRRRFGEAMHLLESHYGSIQKALAGLYWREKLRSNFLPTAGELHLRAIRVSRGLRTTENGAQPRLPFMSRIRGRLSDLVNQLRVWAAGTAIGKNFSEWASKPQDGAQDLLRTISFTPSFVREIAATHPYLGMRLLELKSTWLAREFAETYSRALLFDPESVFYKELRRAENVVVDNTPLVEPDEQPLLTLICKEGLNPHGSELHYAFMDAGIDPLRWEEGRSTWGILNGPIDDFYERGRWTSPPFATIYLVEILSPRIARMAAASTLNLYVLQTLVDALLGRLNPTGDVDEFREWPTPAHFLIYAAVSTLRDSVRMLKKDSTLGEGMGSPVAYVGDGHSLPEQAIQVLGSVMYSCLRSARLSPGFKAYLLEVWWEAYSDKYKGDWECSTAVLEALATGGVRSTADMPHGRGVADVLPHVDFSMRYSKAGDALRKRFGIPSN